MIMLAASLFATALAVAPLDCARPETPAYRAICDDPSLRAAENSLRAAYNALVERTPSASRPALSKLWDRFQNRDNCLLREDQRDKCLRQSIDSQRLSLTGAPLGGPGPGAPTLAEYEGRVMSETMAGMNVLLPRFVTPKRPGERIVNRAVGQYFRTRTYPRKPDWPLGIDLAYVIEGSITYATPSFISVSVLQYLPDPKTGRATYTVTGVNQLLDANRPTAFRDLFAADAPPKISASCEVYYEGLMRQTQAEMSRLGVPATDTLRVDIARIAPQLELLENWVFDPQGALVGASWPGPDKLLQCRLSVAEIKPLLAAGVTIWP